MRQILGEGDSDVRKPRRETPAALPTGQRDSQEPALPAAGSGEGTLGRLTVAEDKKPRKNQGPRRKSAVPSKNHYAAQSNKKERDEESAAEDDE
jgi:hypothetical protein